MKAPKHKLYGRLVELPLPIGLWQDILIDFIVSLLPVKYRRNVYDAVLVVIYRYFKIARFILYTKDVAAEELDNILYDEIFLRYSVPRSIMTNRGLVFTLNYLGILYYYLAIRRLLLTAFYL